MDPHTWISDITMPDVGSINTVLRSVSFSHPNSTSEEILVEHSSLTELIDHHFDFTNLLQQTTIRVFEKADGITYRLLATRIFPDEYGANTEIVRIILDGAGQDMKITLQSSVDEGSAKTINGTVRDMIRL